MKFGFLSSLILFCILLAYINKKHKKMQDQFNQAFWERERRANNTRKKPLDDLPYITIPFDTLPMETMAENAKVAEYHTLLRDLSTQKIVNLTGFTNTDLKLQYGTANITCLSEYDQNYTLLARTLQQWAELLYLDGHISDAKTVLEYAISTRTDASHSYYLLADIYDKEGISSQKEVLIEKALDLPTSMKNIIARTLQGSGPYSGWLHS